MDAPTAKTRLTVAEFIEWADAQTDDRRYELLRGEIVAQSSPLRRHSRVLAGMMNALQRALPEFCEVLPGSGVQVGGDTALEPDAVVFCGDRPGDETRYEGDPTIIVEVLSPSTARYDMAGKADAYLTIDSLQHYLIVDPAERFVIIHSRGPEDNWGIVKVAREDFTLDPPGATISFDTIFATLDTA